jgi:hypothetical protein
MPCGLVEVHRRFGGTYYFQYHDLRISKGRKQQDARSKFGVLFDPDLPATCLLLAYWLSLPFDPED